MFAQFRVKDVNHHIAEVQYDPPALRVSFLAFRAKPGVARPTQNLLANGFQVWLRVARADHQIIRHRGDLTNVEDNDVFRFLVQSRIAAQFR